MEFLRRTWAEINSKALVHNFNLIKSHCGSSKIMAVIKADAYGHSAEFVAPILDNAGADSFAVSNITEALQLRSYGITKPILILGYTPANYAKALFDNNITQAVFSFEYAARLNEQATEEGVKIPVHIKLDTGMGRLGFDVRQDFAGIDEALKVFELSNIEVTGTFTHFPVADCIDSREYTENQLARFISATDKIKSAGFNPGLIHCANSAGLILGSDYGLDICRAGIILYGLNPSKDVALQGLKPVMSVKSVVSMVKTVKKGDTISYGKTFTAGCDMLVATVTAGYADGYPRLLSGTGEVIINGKRAKILGRICMDQFVIDVTDIGSVTEGTEVLLFGEELTADEIAEKCGTINYEIICGITHRVPRIII